MKQAIEEQERNRDYDVESIVNDEIMEHDMVEEDQEARKKSCLKNFLFGPVIDTKE